MLSYILICSFSFSVSLTLTLVVFVKKKKSIWHDIRQFQPIIREIVIKMIFFGGGIGVASSLQMPIITQEAKAWLIHNTYKIKDLHFPSSACLCLREAKRQTKISKLYVYKRMYICIYMYLSQTLFQQVHFYFGHLYFFQ